MCTFNKNITQTFVFITGKVNDVFHRDNDGNVYFNVYILYCDSIYNFIFKRNKFLYKNQKLFLIMAAFVF